jgi:acylphosphatase
MTVTVRYVVSGRVQGVGFRWFAQRTARSLHLTGWVRNLPDGRVEIVAQGPTVAIAAFGNLIASGPRIGHVDDVEIYDIPHDTNTYKSFDIK